MTFRLIISGLDGSPLCELEGDRTWKVWDVKNKVQKTQGICVCMQQLVMAPGDTLSDDDALHERMACKGTQVVVTLIRRSLEALRLSEIHPSELKGTGFCASCLRVAGVTASQLLYADFSVSELRDAGFTANDMILDQVRNSDFAAFHFAHLRNAGFTARQLRDAHSGAQSRASKRWFLLRLRDAGFDAKDLRDAGYEPWRLRYFPFDPAKCSKSRRHNPLWRGAGFSIEELHAAGFGDKQLRASGFDEEELRRVSLEVPAKYDAM